MTNFEKIKSMSVKEMAEFIFDNYRCRKCACANNNCDGKCKLGIAKWLKKEVSE